MGGRGVELGFKNENFCNPKWQWENIEQKLWTQLFLSWFAINKATFSLPAKVIMPYHKDLIHYNQIWLQPQRLTVNVFLSNYDYT